MACKRYLSINEIINSVLIKNSNGEYVINVVSTNDPCASLQKLGCGEPPIKTLQDILNHIITEDACGNPAINLSMLGSGGVAPTPPRYSRDEFINPTTGTTSFTLANSPLLSINSLPPIVTIGGVQIPSSDWSISGTTFNYPTGVLASGGGAGGQDVIITYQY